MVFIEFSAAPKMGLKNSNENNLSEKEKIYTERKQQRGRQKTVMCKIWTHAHV